MRAAHTVRNIKNKEKIFLELLKEKMTELSCQHPFDADYTMINKFKFISQGRFDSAVTLEDVERKNTEVEKYFSFIVSKEKTVLLHNEIKNLADKINEATEDEEQESLGTLHRTVQDYLDRLDVPHSHWLTETFKKFKEKNKSMFTSISKDDSVVVQIHKETTEFMRFLLENSEEYLPDEYDTQANSAAEFRFPSSISGKYIDDSFEGGDEEDKKSERIFAHFDIGLTPESRLLAMSAPLKTDTPELHDAYLKMFWETGIKRIVSLDVINPTIADYKKLDTKRFKTTFNPNTNKITLFNRKTKETKEIDYDAFIIADVTALNLDNVELRSFSKAYDVYSKGNAVAMHCTSGVGRTGFGRMLFALSDEYKKNPLFKMTCDQLRELSLIKDTTSFQEQFSTIWGSYLSIASKTVSTTLCHLRKIRLCLQTEPQLTELLPQLLLLISANAGLDDVYLDQLRGALGVTLPERKTNALYYLGDYGVREYSNASFTRTPSNEDFSLAVSEKLLRDLDSVVSITATSSLFSPSNRGEVKPVPPCAISRKAPSSQHFLRLSSTALHFARAASSSAIESAPEQTANPSMQ